MGLVDACEAWGEAGGADVDGVRKGSGGGWVGEGGARGEALGAIH